MCFHDMDFSFPRWIRSTWYFPAAIPYTKRNKKRPDLILICEFPLLPLDPFKGTENNFLYAHNSYEFLWEVFYFPAEPYDVTAQADNTLVLMTLREARIFYISTINCLLYVNHMLYAICIQYDIQDYNTLYILLN
jgi:hypothetical protein